MEKQVKVAVNTFLIKDGKVLLGKRLNAVGAGTYGVPGGHVEYGESLVDAAKRELLEETGIVPETMEFMQVINSSEIFDHYLHVNFLVEEWTGDIKTMEPHKCEGWEWFDFDDLPINIFEPHKLFFEAYKQKKVFYDK